MKFSKTNIIYIQVKRKAHLINNIKFLIPEELILFIKQWKLGGTNFYHMWINKIKTAFEEEERKKLTRDQRNEEMI